MYEAMRNAPLGDDVFGDDPTVQELEALAAEKVGQEAALFVPSGTMGNLLAILCHTQPGDGAIVEATSHTFYFEVGGVSRIAGVLPHTVRGVRGFLPPEEIEAQICPGDLHRIRTSLLCIENTHNLAGGIALTLPQIEAMTSVARQHGLAVHLDGARLFNAAVALGVDVRDITRSVDSVMFCLSKGLGCPVGSMLCGTQALIDKARRQRKLLGGGMRQAGVLAACGIIALNTMIDRLSQDHANARRLAERLSQVDGVDIDMDTVQTNMVYCRFPKRYEPETEIQFRRDDDVTVKAVAMPAKQVRFATHKDVSREDVELACDIVAESLS
jgi:threonine aldolase